MGLWPCSFNDAGLAKRVEEDMSWGMLAAPVFAVDRMFCSTGLTGIFDRGDVDDPSDGARSGADPTDPRGRSSSAELLGLLAG